MERYKKMGMYDTVVLYCPKCSEEVDFQSKAGDCELNRYTVDFVPVEIAKAINGNTRKCKCGYEVTIKTKYDIGTVPMEFY